MPETPTEARIILEAIENRLLDVHTALPGKITKYTPAAQEADIELQVRRQLENDDGELVSEELPILPNVPIAFPRSSSYFCSFPLAAGDKVLVIFSEASVDTYRSKNALADPGDTRRLSLTGAVAIPCDITLAGIIVDAALASKMVLGKIGGARVVVDGNEVSATKNLDGDGDDFVAQSQKVRDENQIMYDALVGVGQPLYPVFSAAQALAWINAIGPYLDAMGYPNPVASSSLKSDD